MSSPCNMPRLVRCRVKDFASCFYACRLPPLEEETDNSPSKQPSSHRVSSDGPKVIGSKAASGAHKARKKTYVENGDKSSSRNLSRNVSRVSEYINGSEPRFADEDYIVFCFREDGKIDMINDGINYNKSSSSSEIDDGHELIISAATNLRPVINMNKEDEINEINSIEQPNSPTQMDSFESCDSNLSDTSTSSFAFPTLGINWIGSPVHMPRPEKPEARCLSPNCCRF
ncbi:hypothetical protein CASFOL_025446 [Castilleja foliolosa]|uniref:Uncharacterized protein n=1 Tax=Castilleja foliolosa TaxID=1961234 RepID=A0ABD3CV69_9LAMI